MLALKWRTLFIISILVSSLAFTPPLVASSMYSATAASPGVTTTHWVTGYYVGYQQDMLPPEDIDWNGLTQIAMGAVEANSDGTLDTSFYTGSPETGAALAKTIARYAHDNNTKAILMLGGAGNGDNITLAYTNHRTAFISNLVATMNNYGYDGIDVDWEDNGSYQPADLDLVLAFVKDLRQAAPNAIITYPIGVINPTYQTVDTRVILISQYVDQMSLMSYDPCCAYAGEGWYSWYNCPLSGAKTGTPVSIEDTLARYANATYNNMSIPKSKLGMGIGFYAIGYMNGVTGPNQPTDNTKIVGGDGQYPLSMLFGGQGAYDERYRHWDPVAFEPYLSLPGNDSFGCRYISYEDEQSILAKGNFARQNGYGGIIIWTMNQGYVASHSNPNFLMEALRKAFIEPNASLDVGVSVIPAREPVISGTTASFRAFVTGTTNKNVTWSVQEPNGGTIDQNGVYMAPTTVQPGMRYTYHIVATSKADPSRSGTATIMVGDAQALRWDPGLHLTGCAQWWVSVSVDDANITALELIHNGVTTPMNFWGVYGGQTHYTVSTEVDAGDMVQFHALNKDGREVTTLPIAYSYVPSGTVVDIPVSPMPNQSAYSLSLSRGWNLVSLPLANDSSWASGLPAGSGVDKVAVFNGNNQTFSVYRMGQGGPDIPFMPDKGYFLNCTQDHATLTFYGTAVGRPRTLTLYPGWNLVGWTPSHGSTSRAFGALDPHICSVARYNAGNSSYSTYLVGTSRDDRNFAMSAGNGYFVYSNATTLINVSI